MYVYSTCLKMADIDKKQKQNKASPQARKPTTMCVEKN